MTRSSAQDELAIHRLVARYCHAIVQRDDDAWAQTWDEAAEWNVLGRSVRGREEILALYRKLVGGARWIVQIPAAGVIELAGDRATGRWFVTEYLQATDGTPLLSLGLYRDQYLRGDDGAWRFAHRWFAPSYFGKPDLSGVPLPLPENF
jgi:hypothetical protein